LLAQTTPSPCAVPIVVGTTPMIPHISRSTVVTQQLPLIEWSQVTLLINREQEREHMAKAVSHDAKVLIHEAMRYKLVTFVHELSRLVKHKRATTAGPGGDVERLRQLRFLERVVMHQQ
jgi:hypothetical protein